ncbi:MAG: hypothetical protein OEY72_07730 [Gammaproteobacteria bacterium]|nr:hypothetical protein [Gammaproteobacteria bacterium]MDH5500973.1 hypothetical protein [Gammaproteobacteria bacterium]
MLSAFHQVIAEAKVHHRSIRDTRLVNPWNNRLKMSRRVQYSSVLKVTNPADN